MFFVENCINFDKFLLQCRYSSQKKGRIMTESLIKPIRLGKESNENFNLTILKIRLYHLYAFKAFVAF